eukprot:TRINITY_DN116_c0_g1_i2.p1 TRINITY_DN116_c0_g1~~TRINITY_DN116_c0_g1_i2.p1  ORF type:complete len:218 (+),score=57.62 TRINITY_DN116_c0_g1_i2:74-727(+)
MFGQSASLFGSQLGGFISGVANKIKEQIAVSHEEFMREREKYDNPDAVAAPASPTVPIWTHMAAGDKDLEAKLREHALIIACEKSTFLEGPPPGEEFNFDLEKSLSVVMETLNWDPNLEKQRFLWVPRKVLEPTFWGNYFYHVDRIAKLLRSGKTPVHTSTATSETLANEEEEWKKKLQEISDLASAANTSTFTTEPAQGSHPLPSFHSILCHFPYH